MRAKRSTWSAVKGIIEDNFPLLNLIIIIKNLFIMKRFDPYFGSSSVITTVNR